MDFGKTVLGAAEREMNLRGAFDFGETQELLSSNREALKKK